MLGAKRPDIQIVGDELHPLLKVTDFAPYIAKIKASGADTRHHRQLGQGLALLVKAAADAGLRSTLHLLRRRRRRPTAVKQTGLDHRVFQIAEGIANAGTQASADGLREGVPRQGRTVATRIRARSTRCAMFEAAAEKAKSTDPVKVAAALEGMKFEVLNGGEAFMRKDDHQFFQPMYISSFGKLSDKEPFDEENTGWGWQLVAKVDRRRTRSSDDLQDERGRSHDIRRFPRGDIGRGKAVAGLFLIGRCSPAPSGPDRDECAVLELIVDLDPERRAATACCCSCCRAA